MPKYKSNEILEKKENEKMLGQELFDSETELFKVQQEKAELGQKLFDLETQLIMKGVI